MPTVVNENSAPKKPVARLSPEELGKLAQRLIDETDPQEVERLKAAFVHGWYGAEAPHA